MPNLDVIIPVHNEAENIDELVKRLTATLNKAKISYTLIFVDDHSTDNSVEKVNLHIKENNVVFDSSKESRNPLAKIILVKKRGPRGKATAILEGVNFATSNYIAMIDADLQYPPEALPKMLNLAQRYGICVANRKSYKTSFLRKAGSKINRLIFEKLLLGFDCDVQSGLKVFKREILQDLSPQDVTPWTLDISLLVASRNMGYKIATFDIDFAERKKGISKVKFVKTGVEIAIAALKSRLRRPTPIRIQAKGLEGAIGAGIIFKGRRFITHNYLDIKKSSFFTLNPSQKLILFFLFLSILLGLFLNWRTTLILSVGVLSTLFFIDFVFTLYVLMRSLKKPPEITFSQKDFQKINSKSLPLYSVLCPLYKEANILPQFIESIKKLDWPKNKLEVLLLLEEDDKETIDTVKKMILPRFIKVLIVPHSLPKTKPKACNFGLAHARGEYIVIYDAEDKPDPLQLKKAYIAFTQKTNSKVVCLQSKLNYYNSEQNLLTRLFTAEYSLWFDLILPGLQLLKTGIPLGGTSNHFKTRVLRYLGGWDPFNVTEDCDLGARLFKEGFQTEIIDSTTYEEANSRVKNWLKQRSRWIKGYLQTYFVHTRDPLDFIKKRGIHAFIFRLVIGARMVFVMVNPILWAVTVSYFVFRKTLGPTIESLYPMPVFYIAVIPMIFGNFAYLYNYMIALGKRGKWELIKYIYFVPFYWAMASFASGIALYQLIVKPHFWEKTEHGLHLLTNKKVSKFVPASSIQAITSVFSFSKAKAYLRRDSVAFGALMLMLATILVNFTEFLYNAYLGRKLNLSEFGTVVFLGNVLTIAGILGSALIRVSTYKSGYLLGKYGTPIKSLWLKMKKKMWSLSLILTFSWIALLPFLTGYFNVGSLLPFLIFAPYWTFIYLIAVNSGFLVGNQMFSKVAVVSLIESLSKLLVTFATIELGLPNLVYSAIPVSGLITYAVSTLLIKKIADSEISVDKNADLNFPRKFFLASLLTNVSVVAFLSIDVILAKHYLTPLEAGQYALLSLSGKIIYFISGIFVQFVNPIISRHEGQGRVSRKTFHLFLAGTFATSLAGYIAIGLLGKVTMPFLFGDKAMAIVGLTPFYGVGIVAYSIASFFAIYHQVRKHYIFSVLACFMAVVQIVYITMFHSSVSMIAMVTATTGILFLIYSVVLHVSYKELQTITNNLFALFNLFGVSSASSNGRLKILIFNWRDIKHAWAGGAEVYIHEIAKRWVAEGHEVTLFCGNDGRNKSDERVDGVLVLRRGGFFTVYLWAFLYYIFKFRKEYDVIIDCQNGVPFFTPFYSTLPKILLIHHIHQSVFRENLSFPFSTLAMFLESRLMPIAYRNVKMVTVSESSKSDMEKIGLSKNLPIDIVQPGIDVSTFRPGVKSKNPSILYLGRLKPYKSIDTVIKAMPRILEKHPNATLHIAGFGEARKYLENLTKKLDLSKHIKFWGRVSDRVKIRLMQSSWVFVYPSTMEGWGISAIEANACATPVVASNVPGLRDSVRNPSSGFLVSPKKEDEFAEKINLLLSNSKLRKTLSKESVKWAKGFTWDKSAHNFMNVIIMTINIKQEPSIIPETDLAMGKK